MKKMDIIIFGGQSNMQGQSETLTNTDVVQNAYEYKLLEHRAVPLRNPVGENVKYDMSLGDAVSQETDLRKWLEEHVLGAACYGNTNLVPAFCKSYIANCEEKAEVLAVHAAKGSTQIIEWLPGTRGYGAIVEKSRSAIDFAKKNYEIRKIYFVWLQGESDAIARMSKNTYKENLLLLSKSLEKDLKIEQFGVIRVGRFTNDDRDLEIIGAQDEICKENDNFTMLTEIATNLNEIKDYMNPNVRGHYSAKGLEKLGEEAGKALAEYKNGGQ